METFFVYIIISQKSGRFYTGMSSNPKKRIDAHNLGLNKSTKNKGPWNQIWLSEPLSKKDALELESKIKKRGAKRFLEDEHKILPRGHA